MNDNVRGDNILDVALDCLARRMRLLEARGARHADGHVHEIALASPAHAHAFGLQHAFGLIHGIRNSFAQALRGHVEQRVHGLPAQP